MSSARQGPDRGHQRARTRQALIDAAVEMLRHGHQPTVAEAAAAAHVHRATAYRYFPTPQALLVDATLTAGMPDPASMYAGVAGDDPVALMDAGICAVADFMYREPALFRSIVRVTIDGWFARQESTVPNPDPIRNTRRFGLIDRALEPLQDQLPDDELRRLRHALALVFGAEALITMSDVCSLDADEGTEVMRWAGGALIRAAMTGDANGQSAPTATERRARPNQQADR